MDDSRAIGARIRDARIKKGLTQADLAAAIGVSRAHLTNVEGGNGGLALDKLSILAKEIGATVAWLIGEGQATTSPLDIKTELLAVVDAMSEEQRRALLTVAKVMRPDEKPPPDPRPKRRASS
jgi:transcriptional regulator with XRE-family HTH domain